MFFLVTGLFGAQPARLGGDALRCANRVAGYVAECICVGSELEGVAALLPEESEFVTCLHQGLLHIFRFNLLYREN